MLGKLLGKASAARCSWIHSIIDGNLAVLTIEELVNILTAFPEDLLS